MAELSTPSVCLGKILIQVSVSTPKPPKRQTPVCFLACACVTLSALHFSLPLFHPVENASPVIPGTQLVHARRLPLTVSYTNSIVT